ncbi:beta-amylase 1, chloroplastic-like isoform X2 [Manihot esculenta]|uniref:beta-amylase 1, chloroplastic-like isoform X2 n=1 Tax=Manihot esculenta TaxID=3983 RepID=UPI001CC4DA90|nr:beta-amylase 1, chloroplastic-like isoform X2 [Manihot esculenta]
MPEGFGAAQRRKKGSPVFVLMPVDAVDEEGKVRRKKIMMHSLRALALAEVEGVVIEVWWGLVERDQPGAYNWQPYLELVQMAVKSGLKVRVVLAFHESGRGPGDPNRY